ncbi:hypothetical protein GQ53DRAFT_819106 [Thozetella sp. PMI_491]|nr:hypothetical protein GQ53DRAFT_819106 [Thozetella sp. PMI_491]
MSAGTGDSGPRTYRARKRKPCDACRRRKICCVRESDSVPCALCQMRSQQCTFLSQPNARRRTTVAQVRASESPSSSTADHETPAAAAGSYVPQELTGRPNVVSEEWISQFVGLSGDQDPYVLRHCQFDGNRYSRSGWACLRVKGDIDQAPAHFTIVPDSHLDARPSYYPSHPRLDGSGPETHRALLRTYLSVVHASFPLLDPALLKRPPAQIDAPLLGAMYSLARNFSKDVAISDENIYGWRVFMYQAMPIEARHPRLETVEAALCWVQRNALIHRVPTTPGLWSEIGSLVGMAHDLGLNVDPSGWEMEQSQKSRRIRLAWGLFAADKWAALGLGRPSYISRDDWNVPMVTMADFPDDDTPASAKAVFIAMAKLSLLLAEALHKFYTMRAQQNMRGMSADELTEMTGLFEDQLDAFYEGTLAPLEALASGDAILDPSGTVELAYHTLQVVIYRAVLRYLPPAASIGVRERARACLLDAVDFLSRLQVSRLRAFWWSPSSRINFALVGSFMFSMLLSSVGEDEVDFWTKLIARYRRLLDLHSDGFDTTKLAAARLELLASFTEAPAFGI